MPPEPDAPAFPDLSLPEGPEASPHQFFFALKVPEAV